jgi:hypothetical protein
MMVLNESCSCAIFYTNILGDLGQTTLEANVIC